MPCDWLCCSGSSFFWLCLTHSPEYRASPLLSASKLNLFPKEQEKERDDRVYPTLPTFNNQIILKLLLLFLLLFLLFAMNSLCDWLIFGLYNLTFAVLLLHTYFVASLKLTASSRSTAPPSSSTKCFRCGYWLTSCTLNTVFTYFLRWRCAMWLVML